MKHNLSLGGGDSATEQNHKLITLIEQLSTYGTLNHSVLVYCIFSYAGLGFNTGVLAPPRPAKSRARCWVREVVPLPLRIRGYHTRKIFENSDAKSCILVTNFLLLENYDQEVGGPIAYIVGPPT